MSCETCEMIQVENEQGRPVPGYYVRAGNGNVQLVGCSEHVRIVIEAYRIGVE